MRRNNKKVRFIDIIIISCFVAVIVGITAGCGIVGIIVSATT